MDSEKSRLLTRRNFVGTTAAFMIVPRHVLGGAGYVPPSEKINLASIGLGRQGMAVTMSLLARTDLQVVAVCDPNEQSKDYNEYGSNDLLLTARKLLGPGYENWGEDLASPGMAYLIPSYRTSLGMGGRRSREAGRGSVLQLAQEHCLQGLHRVSRFP